MLTIKCRECGSFVGEYENSEVPESIVCPECGSLKMEVELILCDRISLNESIHGKTNKMPGKKKPAYEFQAGDEYSVSKIKFVSKQRVIDRAHDRYYEDVRDKETGEEIHHCEEKLSEHFGHGSAKESKNEE